MDDLLVRDVLTNGKEYTVTTEQVEYWKARQAEQEQDLFVQWVLNQPVECLNGLKFKWACDTGRITKNPDESYEECKARVYAEYEADQLARLNCGKLGHQSD